ncbi:MAG: hypothetical protein IKT59_09870 [Bacteroidales bacterium]|nr:hypothetical protein [Bacteroidales bacterium]
MKFKLFSFFVLAGLLLGSCAVDELPAEGGSIVAEMETDQTKTSVTDEGTFTWSNGDQVWLHTTSGSVAGTLSSGAGTSSAQFTYGAHFGSMTGKAVYPYNAGHAVSENELSIVLPSSYDLGSGLSNTNAAMYGVNVGGTIKFNHLAGVMRFKFKDVPAGVNKFTITLDKKINGTFAADLTADYPVIETSATSTAAEKTITLNFNALTAKSDICVYVPLPIGTYNSLELGLYDDGQSVWTYSNTVTNTISRKTLKLMPTVTMGGSIGGEIEGDDNSSATTVINLSEAGTANSYIVSSAGTYKFTPTKGNSSESVGAITYAEVLWESFGTDVTPNVGDLVKNVRFKDGVISFDTPATFTEGNAVIAARNASGAIIWSWHLWLTDQPEEQVYYNNAGTAMDRNLGATSATPGAVSAMGLLYQWGRKDPFLGSSDIDEHITAKSSYNWPESVISGPDIGTVAYTIANPTTYIGHNPDGDNKDWFYFRTDPNNTLWESQKTKYDPCPPGWRIPDGGETGIWSKASNSSDDQSFTYDKANKGMNFTGKFGEYSVIWYPDQSKSAFANSCGDCYWSCTPAKHSIYYLGISDYGRFWPAFSGVWRSDAHHVRCVKE